MSWSRAALVSVALGLALIVMPAGGAPRGGAPPVLSRFAMLQGQNPKIEHALARAALHSGRKHEAVSRLQALTDKYPERPRYRRDFAEALGLVGRCDEALSIFDDLRMLSRMDARGYAAEGRCYFRIGALEASAQSMYDAALRDPSNGRRWGELAHALLRIDDVAGAQRSIELAYQVDVVMGELYDLRVQHELGNADEADVLIHSLRSQSWGYGELFLMSTYVDGLRWLDLDDPRAALDQLVWTTRRQPDNLRGAAMSAEAHRRLGELIEAQVLLEQPQLEFIEPSPLLHHVRARILVDAGDLAAAAAEYALAGPALPDEHHATGWYLARASGDTAAMDEHAAAWRRIVRAKGRKLEQLIPIVPL